MGRIVGRRRIHEGRSLGERFTEIVVYIVLIAGAIYGARWYFVVYRHSPKVALGRYLAVVKSGDPRAQYPMISASARKFFPTESVYEQQWAPARGLAGRLSNWELMPEVVKGDRAEVTAILMIRKPGQELYQAATDKYKDVYVLVQEADGWKIALDASRLESKGVARGAR